MEMWAWGGRVDHTKLATQARSWAQDMTYYSKAIHIQLSRGQLLGSYPPHWQAAFLTLVQSPKLSFPGALWAPACPVQSYRG